MLIWNPSKLTTKGKALLAKAQAGRCTIKITKAQTGSGQYSSGEATDTRTSLKAPVQTLPIHSKEIQNGSTLVLKVAITNKTSDCPIFITPREDCPSIKVWVKIHIRFVDTNKSLD